MVMAQMPTSLARAAIEHLIWTSGHVLRPLQQGLALLVYDIIGSIAIALQVHCKGDFDHAMRAQDLYTKVL